jgi:uncharacterized protein YrrD
MHYLSELRGIPVISIASGRQLGHVGDVLLDAARSRVIGLIVRRGWLGAEQVLPFEEVAGVGSDAVVVRRDDALVAAREWNRRGLHAPRGSSLAETRVITASGRQIGSVYDVQFEERDGSVAAFDMTSLDGPGGDRQHSMIRHSDVVTVGPDAVVISEATAHALRSDDRPSS